MNKTIKKAGIIVFIVLIAVGLIYLIKKGCDTGQGPEPVELEESEPEESEPETESMLVEENNSDASSLCQDACVFVGQRMCTPGCQTGNQYQVCDDYNDDGCIEWSEIFLCSPGQFCRNGQCIVSRPSPLVPLACSDECTAGQRRCTPGCQTGNQYQICGNYDTDNCSEWSAIQICPSGQFCRNGRCIRPIPVCSNECTAGQRRCAPNCVTGNQYQICGNYDIDKCSEWSAIQICPSRQFCRNGQCVAPRPSPPACSNECSSGQRECVYCAYGNQYRVCGNYDNDNCTEWSTTRVCSVGYMCESGQCIKVEHPDPGQDVPCNDCDGEASDEPEVPNT